MCNVSYICLEIHMNESVLPVQVRLLINSLYIKFCLTYIPIIMCLSSHLIQHCGPKIVYVYM